MLRGQGRQGFIGWPESAKLEQLREDWFEAPDLESQQRIAAELQKQMFEDVPYIPLGQFFQPLAHRRSVTGVMQPGGIPVFWNVRRV
jgi:peptide/nickel transport system substrate-binding protein